VKKMSKKPVHTEVKSVVPEPFNSLLPGPRYKAETTYSDGYTKTGYGNSKTEAEKNSKK
jgi:hypothetical protein